MAPRWLVSREINRLLRAVQRGRIARDIALISFMLNTGLRVGEVVSLNVGDVEMDWGDESNRKKARVTVRGKGTKYRAVPLNPDVRRALRELSEQYGGWTKANAGETLFRTRQGGRMSLHGVNYVIRKYARIAEIEDLTAHVLRHTFAKNLVDQGVSLDQVAILMGHATLDSTKAYTTPSMNDLNNAVGRFSLEE